MKKKIFKTLALFNKKTAETRASQFLQKWLKKQRPKKFACPHIHASAKGYALCLAPPGATAWSIPPEAWQGPTKFASKGPGGQRSEGLPLEARAGTMASEPKGPSQRKRRAAEHKRKAKSGRAPNKGEDWQSSKERRGAAEPQREARRGRSPKRSEGEG